MINTGKKVYDIMQTFDPRVAGAVLSYLFDKGITNVAEITDQQIDNMEGNAFMTADFCRGLVRTAREIAKQCNLYEDILPFIVCQLPNAACQTREVTLWKANHHNDVWNDLISEFAEDIEYQFGFESDEAEKITICAVVTDASNGDSEI